MTIKLFSDNSYETAFKAQVTDVQQVEGGFILEFDRTLFYPESGGQNCDTGTIAAGGQNCDTGTIAAGGQKWAVTSVFYEGSAIKHLISGQNSPQCGDIIEGRIDWEHRYNHMQRHTAQHLLSQAFVRVNPAFRTVSVAMSSPECTVDFEGLPSPDDIAAAEAVCNDMCRHCIPITVHEVEEEDLCNWNVRRPPKVSGLIRLVKAGDFETAACGGTHLNNTAEALPVKILRSEKIRGNLTRIHFMAGAEAFGDYLQKHEITRSLAEGFSSKVTAIPMHVSSLENSLASLKQEIQFLANLTAQSIFNSHFEKAGQVLPGQKLLMIDAPSEAVLKKLISIAGDTPGILFAGFLSNDSRLEVTLISTCADKSMGDAVKKLQLTIPVKGGGRREMARFAADITDMDKLKKTLAEILNQTV